MRRRFVEDRTGVSTWFSKIFVGKGLDVGAGPDLLPIKNCQAFDKEHGDANNLSSYFKPNSFNYIHGSQVLEHMHNPEHCIADWMKLIKTGGHLIITIPDFDYYEKWNWPSKYNPDHKAAFSLYRHDFPNVPLFYHVPTLLKPYNVKLCRLVLNNYVTTLPDDMQHIDQTYHECDGIECFIEFVLEKK